MDKICFIIFSTFSIVSFLPKLLLIVKSAFFFFSSRVIWFDKIASIFFLSMLLLERTRFRCFFLFTKTKIVKSHPLCPFVSKRIGISKITSLAFFFLWNDNIIIFLKLFITPTNLINSIFVVIKYNFDYK